MRAAVRRGHLVAHRQALRCATDQAYYASRLTLLFCANLLSIAAVIFAAVAAIAEPNGAMGISSERWATFTGAFVLIFVAFTMRAFVRTVRLARKVLEIRRKLRMVESRKRAAGRT